MFCGHCSPSWCTYGAGGMCQFCDLISCHRNMTRFHRSFSWDTNGLNSADWPEETLKSVEFRTLPAPSYYAENWRCTALHTSRLWWKKNEDNTVHELVPGLVCVEEKLDGKVFGVLLWEKPFELMRCCWVVQCWNEWESRADKKLLLQSKRWYNFSLLYLPLLLSIQVWEIKKKVLILSENLLFHQKCVFRQMNADVHARTGVLYNWKTAENRKKEVHSYHALNCLYPWNTINSIQVPWSLLLDYFSAWQQ